MGPKTSKNVQPQGTCPNASDHFDPFCHIPNSRPNRFGSQPSLANRAQHKWLSTVSFMLFLARRWKSVPKVFLKCPSSKLEHEAVYLKSICDGLWMGFLLADSFAHWIGHLSCFCQPSFRQAQVFPQQLVGLSAALWGHPAWLCSTGSRHSKPGWPPQCSGQPLPNQTSQCRQRWSQGYCRRQCRPQMQLARGCDGPPKSTGSKEYRLADLHHSLWEHVTECWFVTTKCTRLQYH